MRLNRNTVGAWSYHATKIRGSKVRTCIMCISHSSQPADFPATSELTCLDFHSFKL
jgi:hypothetical protein